MEYKVGDRFEVEITDISTSGMGTVIYLNDVVAVSDKQIQAFEKITPVESTEQSVLTKKNTYTLEDMQERVYRLSSALSKAIERLHEMRAETTSACQQIDAMVNAYEDTSDS